MSDSYAAHRGRAAALGLKPGRASNLGFAIACVVVPALVLLAALGLRARYAMALPASSVPLVVIHAGDSSYEMTDTVPAGLVRLRLVNEGQKPHQAVLTRLEPGRTAAAYLQGETAWMHGGASEGWGDHPGGPGLVVPGDSADVTVTLAPGHYVVSGSMTSPTGVPHLATGMVHAFDVVAIPGAAAVRPPTADLTVELTDDTLGLSAPLRAGRRWIHIVNRGHQEHEVQLVRLLPGHSADEATTWLRDRQGPSPVRFEGGLSEIAPGRDGYLVRTLVPGDYLLLCFVPDRAHGASPRMHGMPYRVHVS